VEYIPLVGTLYSIKRVGAVYSERDWKHYWQSVADAIWGGVREGIVITPLGELMPVAIIHDMAANLTNDLIKMYFSAQATPEFRIKKNLSPQECGYVIVAANDDNNGPASRVFQGKHKGVHHFHGSTFKGTIAQPSYAPRGETIQMHLPSGLYDNAPVEFIWCWTVDSYGVQNRPEHTLGKIVLRQGRPTGFRLSSRRGVNWEGYDFWGTVNSLNEIKATTRVGGVDIDITFSREERGHHGPVPAASKLAQLHLHLCSI